MQFVKDLDI